MSVERSLCQRESKKRSRKVRNCGRIERKEILTKERVISREDISILSSQIFQSKQSMCNCPF